ncbi:MAG: VTT domain-containing protein [Anaerolineales bacterium]|jgi:membrane protein DedA with SNARE-associated domain
MASLLKIIGDFLANLQAGILPNLGYWSYVLLALFVAVEGPITTLLGAVAASAGLLKPDLVFLAAGTGNLSADSLWYLLGYAGKKELLLRYGRRFGVRAEHLEKLQRNIRAHAFRLLFIAKITYGLAVPSIVAAGLSRVPWRRWFPPLLAGEVLWTGGLVLFGYYTTETFKQIEKDFRYLVVFFTVSFLLLLIWWLRRVLSTRGKQNDTLDGEF